MLKNNQNLQNLSSFCICLPSDCRPDPSRQDQSHFARDHVLAPDLLARRLEVAVARRRRHPKKEREKKKTCTNALAYNTSKPVDFLEHK